MCQKRKQPEACSHNACQQGREEKRRAHGEEKAAQRVQSHAGRGSQAGGDKQPRQAREVEGRRPCYERRIRAKSESKQTVCLCEESVFADGQRMRLCCEENS